MEHYIINYPDELKMVANQTKLNYMILVDAENNKLLILNYFTYHLVK